MIKLKKGSLYKCISSVKIDYLIHWKAPCSSGGSGILLQNTVVEVNGKPPRHATAVYCKPLNYEEVEAQLIPETERNNEKYFGYSLVIDIDIIKDHFDLVSE